MDATIPLKPIRRTFAAERDEDDPVGDSAASSDEARPGKVSCLAMDAQPHHEHIMDEDRVEAEGGEASMTHMDGEGQMAEDEGQGNGADMTIACSVHGCKVVCTGVAEYESHYQLAHSFVCHDCHRSFPNERLMDRHITERHDPFFKVLSERQPMYECLVEGCGGVFVSEYARQLHLVDKHQFPKYFDYDGMGFRSTQHHKPSLAAKANANRDKQLLFSTNPKEGDAMSVEGVPQSPSSPGSPGSPGRTKVPRCLYFNLPSGCRRGEGCRFKHIPRDHPTPTKPDGAAGEGEGEQGEDEQGAMAVDALSAEMHAKLRIPKHGISFGRRWQDHRRGP